ncbi:MobF family relaxase [Micromonospora sp. WMMA1363]|uniref:MobF family relaxase n=1 Tax=Micromonospora sp. WMMA1363 TaxID=3053985 RepID=UPI00259CA91F|nr:MobF family relaxase [Micromonospora sp. WMMA1363]MDM4723353.1 MobF family relaxase [Micromonospora sp. WMMA1363]
MTLHPLHGGDGYTYLTREVATADFRRTRGEAITDYYHADGNPPGQWVGRAREELDISGTVKEHQMRALFGEGLHPNADAIIEKLIDGGVDPKKAEAQARLGRKPLTYEPTDTYQERVNERYAAHRRITGTDPTDHEKTRLARAVGARMFAEQHGRRPRDITELNQYIAQVAKPQPQAVTGYDLVFTPPKSASVLWALGDDATRRAIEDAHEQAWRSVLADAENTVIKTRAGRAGVAQLDATSGVIAAAFRHHDSRAGDPLLHTHLAIANRVKAPDGRWRTIDGRALFAAKVQMSESYNARVMHGIAQRLDVAVVPVDAGRGRRPVYEIAGIPAGLRTLFSDRRASINARTTELVDAYVRDHGHAPTEEVRHQLAQQATLDARAQKQHARSLATMRGEWRQRAVAEVGERRVTSLLNDARKEARRLARDAAKRGDAADITAEVSDERVTQLARSAVTTVEQQRATWTRHHIEAEVHRQLSAAGLGTRADVAERVSAAALQRESVRITAPTTEPVMPDLMRRDGESVFTHTQTVRYSSERILNAEQRVIEAARTTVIAPISGQTFDRTLAAFEATPGNRRLDPGQAAVARAFTTDARLVVAGIGPAGAGKTTTMRVVARAVEAGGSRVIALAPSARSAAVLAEELSVPAHTIHRWLWHRNAGTRADTWQLRAGDVILVDEAGMAGTLNLDAVIAAARQAGAVVRVLGDPQQLGAVESGGMLRLIQREAGAVELHHLHRFANTDEALASLKLRDGADDSWRWYWSKDRIRHGDRDAMLDAVYQAWRTENTAGDVSLMIAPTNDDTRRLNDRARTDLIAAGHVEATGVELHDGTTAGRGDLIVTRRNESRLRLFRGRDMVLNGDVWRVEDRHRDGSLTVQHTQHGARISLPRAYVAADVELAYATTIHRTQGMTVDKVHAIVDGPVNRVQAYVALTRGRLANRLYVTTDAGARRVHAVLDSIRRNVGAAVSATEEMRESLAAAEYLPNLADNYLHAADVAAAQRHQNAVASALGATAKDVLRSPSWARVSAAITRAERAGWSAPDILDAAGITGLDKADDPGAVLTHRIRATQDRAAQQLANAPERPLAGVTDTTLHRLRDRAAERLADAEKALAWARHDTAHLPAPVRARGREHPAWPDRPHGALTDGALADARRDSRERLDHIERRLTAARRRVHEARTPEQSAATGHRAHVEADARTERAQAEQLDYEQRVRRTMRAGDRAREAAQRADTSTPATADTLAQASTTTADMTDLAVERVERARLIVQRMDDEAALRRRLPTAVRAAEQAYRDGRQPAPQPAVPDWIADTRHRLTNDTSKWGQHLDERREHLAQRLNDMARDIAAQQPQWAIDTLGQRPDDTRAALAWDRAASLAAAYRQMYAVPDEEPRVLGREPRPQDPRRQAYEETRQAIEPVRADRARANRAASAEQARDELRRKLRQVAQRPPIDPTTGRDSSTERTARQDRQAQAARTQQDQQRQAEQRTAEQQHRAEQQRRQAQQRQLDEQRRQAEQQRRGPQRGPHL